MAEKFDEGSLSEYADQPMSPSWNADIAGREIPDTPQRSVPATQGEPAEPFAQRFFDTQTTIASEASESAVLLPQGGPKTEESARQYTRRSDLLGRTETHVPRIVARSELGPEGRSLEDEFRDMVQGDYGKRCQICCRSFERTGGGLQVFVVHIVPPHLDHRTNHFGDLLGLCGWHFALVRFGAWAMLNPNDGKPFERWESMSDFLLNAPKKVDDMGNSYVAVGVRFWNVYEGWEPGSTKIDEKIRYSIPHWKFLCELIKA